MNKLKTVYVQCQLIASFQVSGGQLLLNLTIILKRVWPYGPPPPTKFVNLHCSKWRQFHFTLERVNFTLGGKNFLH